LDFAEKSLENRKTIFVLKRHGSHRRKRESGAEKGF